MFYLVKVLIGRVNVNLNKPFSYYTLDESIKQGMRVLVSFGASKETVAFVIEEPVKVDSTLEEYEEKNNIKLAKIIKKIDDEVLLNSNLMLLAKQISEYYQADLIRVLNCMLPPSLKPKNSALKKPQSKFANYVFVNDIDVTKLSKQERTLYLKIKNNEKGIRDSKITAKKTLQSLLEKEYVRIEKVPVYRISEIEGDDFVPFDLTNEQNQAYETVLNGEEKTIFLLQGVTGSGKSEVYIKLAQTYLSKNQGVLILIPEIALTDRMASLFASYFQDQLAILNSSLSDSKRYDIYKKILSGEYKIVLGTRSAVFMPVMNLGLIIIDEEHSNSYKQDSTPYYDAIKVAQMRCENENCKLLLGSATPRVIDKVRAERGIYKLIYMNTRYAKNQEKNITIVDMNDSSLFTPQVSALISLPLQQAITATLAKHEQVMILLNRRGYAPIYMCRDCHKMVKCPNCNIPLSYHKRNSTLCCHHCGYKIDATQPCSCGSHDFLTLGYGTEQAYEELKHLYPLAKITRLDSDVSSNEVRHEVLQSFADGETDIIVGTQIIAKGHNFPKVTLAALLNADATLQIPSYLANEQTFDLISQFVGRAGRKELKGNVIIQTYSPENEIILLASKQDYESFYKYELLERQKYQYPPYTYLALIIVKGMDNQYVNDVASKVREYLIASIGNKRFNVYGPLAPYIPHINNRYYKNILVKYKSLEEAREIFKGLNALRLANKECEILINVDPSSEGI